MRGFLSEAAPRGSMLFDLPMCFIATRLSWRHPARRVMACFLFLGALAAASPAENKTSAAADAGNTFYTPKRDLDGLRNEGPEDPDLPNVLLIGDSISIGYTTPVVELLRGTANVRRPNVNCGDTDAGLKGLTKWLGEKKWDVIHFNWGLHDLCYRNPEVKTVGNKDKVNGRQSVPPETYGRNLELLVQMLRGTGAKLIWASTTVVPEGEPGRFAGDEIKYNEIARQVMDRHGIPVNDLHALAAGFDGKYATRPRDVHYSKEGSDKIAKQVAEAIRSVGLGEK